MILIISYTVYDLILNVHNLVSIAYPILQRKCIISIALESSSAFHLGFAAPPMDPAVQEGRLRVKNGN